MSKHALVTGSAGFLGSHFVDHILAKTDWRITGLDSFAHRGDSLRVYQSPERYTVYTHDLTTPISCRLADKIGPVDYVINLASESHVDRAIADPVPFVKNNVNLTLTMLEYVRMVKPEIFLQMSTDESFGPAPEGVNHKEWDTTLPSNPYAASKAAQEALAISYWRTYGVPTVIINGMNLIGERQDKEKFLPLLISRVQSGDCVTIHGTPEYIGKRKYLHCRNVSDAILFILNRGAPTAYLEPSAVLPGYDRPDRYNVVGDIELSNLELAQMVAEILKKPLRYELMDFHAARSGHDRRYSLSGDKLKDLGWVAPVEFHASLRKIIEWTLAHEEWLR